MKDYSYTENNSQLKENVRLKKSFRKTSIFSDEVEIFSDQDEISWIIKPSLGSRKLLSRFRKSD